MTSRFATVLLAASLALCAGCHGRSQHSSTTSTINTARGDACFVEDGAAVFLIDGRIRGAEAAGEFGHQGLLDMWGELHDHPQLAEMEGALDDLERAAGAADVSLDRLIAAAAPLPFGAPLERHLFEWAGEDPERAAQVLDRAEWLELNDARTTELLERALRVEELDDARLAVWASAEPVYENETAVRALLASDRAAAATCNALLLQLDELHGGERADVLLTIGQRQAAEPAAAIGLVASLSELHGGDRQRVALSWLDQPDTSDALRSELLAEIDNLHLSDRFEVFERLVPGIAELPGGPRRLGAALEELALHDRGRAALGMLSREASAVPLATAVLAELDEVSSGDRERVLEAVIEAPGYQGEVQRACARAAERELHGKARRRVLQHVIDSPRTHEPHRETARHWLEG